MGERPFLRYAARAAIAAGLLLLACGETRSDPDRGLSGGSGAGATSGATASEAGAGSAEQQAGGTTGSTVKPPDVDYGPCVFEDPNVQVLVGYQILQADAKDGPVDGSAGPEQVTRLDVTQAVGAIGGIECLKNLEQLSLGVYEPEAPPVDIGPLAGLSKLRELRLYGPFVLGDALGQLPLESLTLHRALATSLDDVAKAKNLEELWLEDVPLSSLSGAQQLSRLTKLRIKAAPLESLEPLAKIAGLEELTLTGLPKLTSLAGIETHVGLRTLLISEVPVTSLEPLTNAAQLQSLNVWTSSLTSLAGLAGKLELSTVVVTNARVRDITSLNGLPKLSYASLSGNQLDELAPLATCPLLSSLDVSKNRVASLAPLANMATLSTLIASDNLLEAIDPDLPASLVNLYISGNPITSLEPLAGRALETLAISSTRLTSFAPLANLPALRHLTADDVGATELSVFPLAQLQALSARENHISDVTELSGLGEVAIDLSGNDVVSLDAAFVGPDSECGGLVLADNPLDADALARLAWLCEQGVASFVWDGGACDFCPII